MLNPSVKSSCKTATQYWGFRELTEVQAACVSGGQSIEECMSDGDGETECIPRIEIIGQRGERMDMGFAPTSFTPNSFSLAAAGGGAPDLPPLSKAQKEEFCKYVANEAVAEVGRAKKDGRIGAFARALVPSDDIIRNSAFTVCMNGLPRST